MITSATIPEASAFLVIVSPTRIVGDGFTFSTAFLSVSLQLTDFPSTNMPTGFLSCSLTELVIRSVRN